MDTAHDNDRSAATKIKLDVTAVAPRELNVVQLVQSHAKEIRALTKAVSEIDKTRNASQAMPRHMRRRAASHNIKRLPRRIREQIKQKLGSGMPKKLKPPSRYHRRRPKNLYDEYTQRQRNIRWLETHIWHAKRCHMVESWGYRLPLRLADKGVRTMYRAAKDYCLIHDQSYYSCLELAGNKKRIQEVLAVLLPCDQEKMTQASRDGCAFTSVLYWPQKYPLGAVAPVDVLPCNSSQNQSSHSQTWIWCHPGAFTEVWEAISLALQAQDDQSTLGQYSARTSICGQVTLTCLRDDLIQFSLTGRRSMDIIKKVFSPPKSCTESGNLVDKVLELLPHAHPGSMFDLMVRDPRLCMFKASQSQGVKQVHGKTLKRYGRSPVSEKTSDSLCSISPVQREESIWLRKVRDIARSTRMTVEQINKLRAELLVPGMSCHLGSAESSVPVLLVRSPDDIPTWKLILPSTWGMAFWLPFIYHGARAGGLRDLAHVSAERGYLGFPEDFPDTESGQQQEESEAKTLVSTHFKYPPNKRPNYDKLCIPAPFSYAWHLLSPNKPVVMRDRQHITAVHKLLSGKVCDELVLSELLKTTVNLVAVQLTMFNRGVPEPLSYVYLPTSTQLEMVLGSTSEQHGPVANMYSGPLVQRDNLHCTDELMGQDKPCGFVKKGHFSPDNGYGVGKAFLNLDIVVRAARDKRYIQSARGSTGLLVLLRAVSSVQYRYAIATIHTST